MPYIPAMPSTMQIYRPFGGPLAGSGPCRIVPSLWGGRGALATGNYLMWTHRMDIPAGYDVRDGCGRTLGLDHIVYGDGDGIRVTTGGVVSDFVVVWVEQRYPNTPFFYQRVYLLRDTVTP